MYFYYTTIVMHCQWKTQKYVDRTNSVFLVNICTRTLKQQKGDYKSSRLKQIVYLIASKRYSTDLATISSPIFVLASFAALVNQWSISPSLERSTLSG